MAVTEQSRHEVHSYFEETMGSERAATLMEMLPPVGWGDIATKQDLEQLRVATKQDLEQLRVATKQDLETQITLVQKDIAHLRESVETDLAAATYKLSGEFNRVMRIQTTVIVTILSALISILHFA